MTFLAAMIGELITAALILVPRFSTSLSTPPPQAPA
jgi:hypothetical protein